MMAVPGDRQRSFDKGDPMLSDTQYATPDRYEARINLVKKFSVSPKSRFRWIFEHFPKGERLRVLELGCGTGLFWLANRGEIPEGWDITLSDYSAGMLERTRLSLAVLRRSFRYEAVNAEEIAYPDGHFDLVLANNMLYHVENRKAAISHISRVLTDDGVFIASTMARDDLAGLHRCLYDFLDGRGRPFRFRELSFTLDNGYEQLSAVFPKVTMLRQDDALRIDEAEPIVRYYRSFNGMYDNFIVLPDEEIDAFRDFLRGILETRGAITAARDTGIFICRKR
jgi:ubiquinone/menaquinone biosynthesis C-methylase UbiE